MQKCPGERCKNAPIWPTTHAILGTVMYCTKCYRDRYGVHPLTHQPVSTVAVKPVFEHLDPIIYGDDRDGPDTVTPKDSSRLSHM